MSNATIPTQRDGRGFLRQSIQPWGLVSAAGAVASAASVLGFLGSLAWFLDLFAHFRVQYFVALSIIGLLLLIPRRWKTAACFGAFAALNLATIAPLYFGNSPGRDSLAGSSQVLLINVNTQTGDPVRVAALIARYAPDILVLEEVSESWLSRLQPALASYRQAKVQPRDDNFGIALYSKLPLRRAEVVEIGESEVPSIIAEVDTPSGRCTILATHALPPAGPICSRLRNSQLAGLAARVRSASSPVLLVGDLNITPWSPHFRRLLTEAGLRDSGAGCGVQASWPVFNPLLRIPIDHCLHAPEIWAVKSIGPDVGSDHFPVMVEFVVQPRRLSWGRAGGRRLRTDGD